MLGRWAWGGKAMIEVCVGSGLVDPDVCGLG